jgi:hypothetical protein
MLHEKQTTISMRRSRKNASSAFAYTMFAPAQLLRKWHDQRPSDQGDLASNVIQDVGRVYYTETDLLPISLLCRRSLRDFNWVAF